MKYRNCGVSDRRCYFSKSIPSVTMSKACVKLSKPCFLLNVYLRYMATMGAGQMSRNMMLRSNVVLKITQVKVLVIKTFVIDFALH